MERLLLLETPRPAARPHLAEGALPLAPPPGLAPPPLPPAPAGLAGLSPPSAARAHALPAMAAALRAQGAALPPGEAPVLLCRDPARPPLAAGRATLDALAQLADAPPEWWPLAALALAALGVDPAAIPYRSNAACYPPVAPPLPLLREPPPQGWMRLHGYRRGPALPPGAPPGMEAYLRADPADAALAPAALLCPLARPSRPADLVPQALLAAQAWVTAQTQAPAPIPLILILPEIANFRGDWEVCSQHRGVYPAAPYFFDLQHSDNLMYPRLLPVPPLEDKIPYFHPGPALYSWISAPDACRAAIFSAEGPHTDFLCIRESQHGEPTVPCAAEALRLKLNY